MEIVINSIHFSFSVCKNIRFFSTQSPLPQSSPNSVATIHSIQLFHASVQIKFPCQPPSKDSTSLVIANLLFACYWWVGAVGLFDSVNYQHTWNFHEIYSVCRCSLLQWVLVVCGSLSLGCIISLCLIVFWPAGQ